MPRLVRELLIECIKDKNPEDHLFTRENGKPVKDFRRSWESVQRSRFAGLHFHDLRRTAARNMRRGHVSGRVATEVGGRKTTAVFHHYAIVGNQALKLWTCWKRARTSNASGWNRC
jgi:hypothetical protein